LSRTISSGGVFFSLKIFLADKQKWMYLDKDNDQSLTYDEFRQFLLPEDDEKLREIDINSMINEYDADKDGKISNDEYAKMTG
jgi:Ca2+-binding EF-hand superfamily protein